MQTYEDKTGNSGVVAFHLGEGYVDVQFRGGARYRYNDAVPGRAELEDMRRLALAGHGLATYISRHVGDRYAAKLPPLKKRPSPVTQTSPQLRKLRSS